jgi:hypothetical protein
VDHGWHRSTVDHGQGLSSGTTERGLHRELDGPLTRDRVAARGPGDGGEEMLEEALGAGSAWVQREEKGSGERCGREWSSSPFI